MKGLEQKSDLGQSFLLARKAESEPERQDDVLELQLFDELDETSGDVVEQLDAGAASQQIQLLYNWLGTYLKKESRTNRPCGWSLLCLQC